jgi:ribosomal protein S16
LKIEPLLVKKYIINMKGKLEKIDKSKLPVYEIVVDDNDETGISLISLVDEPAISMKGMMFNGEQSVMSFKEVSDDKQIIVGPALIPNMKIYREDEKYGQYYVVFTKETIEKMVEKFNKYGSNRKINIDHSNQMVDAFIMEDWIVENEVYDKSRMYGFEVPVGTYMIMVKVEDTNFWLEEVKGNEKFGFSIEGLLGQQLVSLSKEVTIDDLELEDLLQIFAEVGKYEKGVPHYTADGKLYTGPTHKDASGRLMTGATHTEDSEYLYHEDELAVIGPRGGVKKSPKAPKSDTPNKNPKGEGSAKGDASSSRGAKVSERVEEILKGKADDFNEKYKEKLGYGVDVGMLKSVYQRGVGAFNVSHSPLVKSAEQWALARVNAFIYIVKNGRPENKKYVDDNDLLPKKHPKRT